jgi:hypothetical protein
MKFLDAAYPQSASQFIAALEHEQCQGFTYYIGGNFALNAWPLDVPGRIRAAGYQSMSIFVSTVQGRSGTADGQFAALHHRMYGDDSMCCWDLEPAIFRQNRDAALAYGEQWAQAITEAGLTPVLYSTPDGCAYIGDKGFAAVWAAVPGLSDPGLVFAPTFFPGRVAVQYGSGIWDGVEYDTNISQFGFGALQPPVVPPLPPGDVMPAEIPFPAVLVTPQNP